MSFFPTVEFHQLRFGSFDSSELTEYRTGSTAQPGVSATKISAEKTTKAW